MLNGNASVQKLVLPPRSGRWTKSDNRESFRQHSTCSMEDIQDLDHNYRQEAYGLH